MQPFRPTPRRRPRLTAALLLAALCGLAGSGVSASAHEGPVADRHANGEEHAVAVTLTGVVSVVRGGDQVTGIRLSVTQGKNTTVYTITLDNMGRQLAAHAGKTVSVTGTLRGTRLTVARVG